jgi:hypothetical protein
MKYIILILSVISLIISALWVYHSGFDYEPLIVLTMGIIGLLYHFLDKPKVKKEILQKANQTFQGEQNVNVNVNIGDTEKSKLENGAHSKNEGAFVSRDVQIDSMKPKVRILFIDDDKNFNVVKILKDSGWKNTKSVIDLKV